MHNPNAKARRERKLAEINKKPVLAAGKKKVLIPRTERPHQVYQKYKVCDAKTGKEKEGRYFCLKLDSPVQAERLAVYSALERYRDIQRTVGNLEYADSITKLIDECKRKDGVS